MKNDNLLLNMTLEELATEFQRVLAKRNAMADGGILWEGSDAVLVLINEEAMLRNGYSAISKQFELV
jgi:hypothetical protein